jgi:hypothetical protein
MAFASRSETIFGSASVTITAVKTSPSRRSLSETSLPSRMILALRARASAFENRRIPIGPRTMMSSPETLRTVPWRISITDTGVIVVVVVIVAETCIPGFRSATPMSLP